MTIKEMLEQYESIKAEIQDLKNESKKQHIPLTDTVTGSSVNFPYTKHSISIKGIPEECYTTETVISEKIRELEQERVQIESFLDSVHDSQIRRIIRLKYIEGKTWQQVAFRIGRQDEGTPRKKIEKFFMDSENSENPGL